MRAPRGLLHLLDSIPLLLHPWMQASAVPVILVKDCVLILHTAVANGDIVVPGKDTATLSMMVQMKRESVAEEVLGTEFAVVDIVALSMDTVVKVLITGKNTTEKSNPNKMKLCSSYLNVVSSTGYVDKGEITPDEEIIIDRAPLPPDLLPVFGFRCGVTEVDARSNCKKECTHHVQWLVP